MLKTGEKAPNFSLPDDWKCQKINLSKHNSIKSLRNQDQPKS